MFTFGLPLVASALFFVAPPSSAAVSFLEGSLIRAVNDYRVYYIENSKKRWIESAQAFLIHGFKGNEIRIVAANDLSSYEDGKSLTPRSLVVLPGEMEFLPDIVPFAARDLHLTTRKGRTILKFSSIFFNQGNGPLELIADPQTKGISGDIDRDVYQHIVSMDGTYRDKLVGNFLWHATHGHYHFEDFADYIFEPVNNDSLAAQTIREKTTRCLWDTEKVAPELEGAPEQKVFSTCKNKERQGISVGWGDIYKYTLADQYLDVHDRPAGIYRLAFEIDPRNLFVESRRDNNTSVVLLNLDVKKGVVKVIFSAAPFNRNGSSSYPNGMLVRAEGDERVYVIHKNKKRWLRNETIFNSYAVNSWDDVRVLPKSIVDVIPHNNLLRADGTTVYAINDKGYKRHIRNQDIFNSYELSWDDVADINSTELAQYSDSRLVRVFGDTKLYYIDGIVLGLISPLDAFYTNNLSWDEVHTINADDFSSYTIGSEITGIISNLQ